MAQILRALGSKESAAYIPMREMYAKSHNEVYEAVGEHLAALYELDEALVEPGCFLVQLDNGQLVSFPFGIGGEVAPSAVQEPQVDGNGSNLRAGALMAFTDHWRSYDSVPSADRVGSEGIWDRLFPEILTAVGVKQSEAEILCESAKIEARSL